MTTFYIANNVKNTIQLITVPTAIKVLVKYFIIFGKVNKLQGKAIKQRTI
jgi:hypothetical protein